MIRALSTCCGCGSDEPLPDRDVCEACEHSEARAAAHEPGCRCSVHAEAARIREMRARDARRARRPLVMGGAS